MISRPPHLLRMTLAIVAGLTIVACAKTEPQTQEQASSTMPATAMTTTMDHAMAGMPDTGHAMDPNAPMAMAKAETSGTFGSGKPVTVALHVTDMMSGKPMGPDAFVVAHTEKMHVPAVDPSLTDYSHSHAVPTAVPGDWSFEFTPKFNRAYHLWLDVTPVGGAQQFVLVTVNGNGASAPVAKNMSLAASVGDISATLSFDPPLVAGQAALGHLQIKRNGKPFAALEPVMGAYAHLVGIAEDWTSISHVHPMGTEPTSASDRGGPAIDFHIEPTRAGFLKLFAQIKVDGKDVFLPFGLDVAPSTGKATTH